MGTKRGFTLTEVMIVVSILAVMAGLAVPGYFRTIEQSRMNEALTTLNIIHMGEKIYKLNNGTFWGSGAQTKATISAALNVDINPDFYTDFTMASNANVYTCKVSRNATQGGNTSWYYQYVYNDGTKNLAVTHNP